MRLIDATRLVSDVLKERNKIPLTVVERYSFGVPSPFSHGQSMRGGIRKALRCIEQAQTIDAVPVVRCVDCKHRCTLVCPMYHMETCLDDLDGFDDYYVDRTDDDGFCHLGERWEG